MLPATTIPASQPIPQWFCCAVLLVPVILCLLPFVAAFIARLIRRD